MRLSCPIFWMALTRRTKCIAKRCTSSYSQIVGLIRKMDARRPSGGDPAEGLDASNADDATSSLVGAREEWPVDQQLDGQ